MDHMRRNTVDFRSVEVFVLDEADRMFDMGFINDVRKIIAALPEQRQTMLFSATMPPEVRQLAAGVQNDPMMIQVGEQHNPIETITQHVHAVMRQQKMDLLVHMLQNRQMFSVLVFSRTKHGADKIARKLEQAGIDAVAIHSDRSQSQRQRALDDFKQGKYQVMVATDIVARGIDVRGISHVINFDVPLFAQDYVHRIGRTGRATATGDAITFVAPDEHDQLRRIERFIGRKLAVEEVRRLHLRPLRGNPVPIRGADPGPSGRWPVSEKPPRDPASSADEASPLHAENIRKKLICPWLKPGPID